jgi:catechol 2,3-dioxygenase-like lactoylglutathione lyase family enzyme
MRLNQVTIPSVDVERAVGFYKRFGLVQIVDARPDYARFLCPGNDATFSIRRVDQVSAGPSSPIIYFECDDLDETVLRLKSQGIEFDTQPTDQQWLWREAYLRDPDGNVICLFHAGENRLNPPWRLREIEPLNH